MATEKGAWNLQDVRDKQLAGSPYWAYDTTEFQAWSTGMNTKGQLGLNDTNRRSSPVQIGSESTWSGFGRPALSSGDAIFMLGSKTDGTLWAWGNNEDGSLGQNNQTDYSSPVQIPGTTWSDNIGTTHKSTFATKTDGTLWSWGYNSPSYGHLGHNNKTNYSSPKQVPGTTWDKVVVGDQNIMAIKTDGTLWGWGANTRGMLGFQNDTHYSSPRQVGTRTVWAEIACTGESAALIVKNTPGSWEEGGLYVMGNNEFGQLAENNRTNLSSPRYVSAGWHKVAAAGHSVAAIKSYEEGVGGTLWAWGANQSGELANNEGEPAPRSTPCQIPGTNWTSIQGTYRGFVAGKQDGTMWVWGTNGQGELGLNDRTDRSSPTQVPGSWAAGSGASKLARVYRRKL